MQRASRWLVRVSIATLMPVLLVAPGAGRAEDFPDAIARVDQALRTNPGQASAMALETCLKRRNFAAQLYDSKQTARARRSLAFCFDVLGIPETAPKPQRPKDDSPSMEAIAAQAARELELALELTPDIKRGLEVFRACALCHMPEGWGMTSGTVPQIAGQHRRVVIKQLSDIRAGNRVNVQMLPYASVEAIGGPQAVADVAGYVDTLEINTDGGKGPGDDLELGAALYAENCARCHGAAAEGNAESFVPRLQSQHFKYLLRQFEAIRTGTRLNANPEMKALIQAFDARQARAMLDYVSRLEPPEELRAPPGWHNPDFAPREPMAGGAPK
jgi:cytochrome c553